MKVRRFIFTFGVLLLAFVSVLKEVNASTVILVDTTKPTSFLQSSLSEVSNLCGALPDGERVTLYRLGQGWQPVFDSELTASSRISLGRALNSTYAVRGRPDWVTAVTTAVSVARASGRPVVYIFSHNWNSTRRNNPYRGLTLVNLLHDEQLVPTNVQFVLRPFGGTVTAGTRENVKIVGESPKWQNVLGQAPVVPTSSDQPLPQTSSPNESSSTRPALRYAIGTLLGVVVLLFIITHIKRRRRGTEKDMPPRKNDLALMARASSSMDENPPDEIVHRITRSGGDHDDEVIIKNGERIIVGDHYGARPLFRAAGCHVALSQNGGVVQVENLGQRGIRIGHFPLDSAQRRRVPLAYFEMQIGNETVAITRELRPTNTHERNPLLDTREVVNI